MENSGTITWQYESLRRDQSWGPVGSNHVLVHILAFSRVYFLCADHETRLVAVFLDSGFVEETNLDGECV